MDLNNLLIKIKHLPKLLTGKFKPSGLLPYEQNDKDFKLGSLWGKLTGTDYIPKARKVSLKTYSVKDQTPFNDCVFNGTTCAKEIDEKVVLSVKSLVKYAKLKGYLTGDGWANIKAGQMALQEFGIMEEKDMPDVGHDNWELYSSNSGLDYAKAAAHKIKSYWAAENRNEILQTLENGKAVVTGMKWYSGFNQSGGFRFPWIIDKIVGYLVGGHCIAIVGYDLDKGLYEIQNSYSKFWGLTGRFFIEMDYLDKEMFGWGGYGAFTNLDIDSDLGKIINGYDGVFVKGKKSTIYLIQKGVKKAFPNWATYLAFGGKYKGFTQLNDEESALLEQVKSGDNMDIKKSPAWEQINNIKVLDDKNNELMATLLNMTKEQVGIIE